MVFAAALALAASAHAANNAYQQHNLVSNGAVPADNVDPNLVNAWGIAFNPTGVVWVANNGTGTSTLYNGLGVPQALVVTIPAAPGAQGPGSPTGTVFSGSNDFAVTNGTTSAPSRFLFVSEDGVISGWAPTVDATHAVQAVFNQNAIYKGVAITGNGTGNFLYATDFFGAKIDVFDATFAPVTTPGGFTDPNLPAGYAPFNIQNIGGDLYVTYAKQDPTKTTDVHGPGLGIVNVFDANGNLIRRVATGGTLNAPWGVALAPASFGRFANRLLVGNFGDGTISAFNPRNGNFVGRMRTPDGAILTIDGLWGLAFGNGVQNQPTNTLFFTAGPNAEANGLYGSLMAVPGAMTFTIGDDSDRDDH